MAEVAGARDFNVAGDAYDRFMGRYSRELAPVFADFCGLEPGQRFLDVGCGPGALTAVAVERLGAGSVAAVDPSSPFVAVCRERCPGVDVRAGAAEALPFDDDAFDRAAAQLVLHFVTDAGQATRELARVTRPGGTIAACVWDVDAGMELLHAFRSATRSQPQAPPERDVTPAFGAAGELTALFSGSGLLEVAEEVLTVTTQYADFDEVWATLLVGVGPAGAYTVGLAEPAREQLRKALHVELGEPTGSFVLAATARAARAVVPG